VSWGNLRLDASAARILGSCNVKKSRERQAARTEYRSEPFTRGLASSSGRVRGGIAEYGCLLVLFGRGMVSRVLKGRSWHGLIYAMVLGHGP
jgi:hypothetical protein